MRGNHMNWPGLSQLAAIMRENGGTPETRPMSLRALTPKLRPPVYGGGTRGSASG